MSSPLVIPIGIDNSSANASIAETQSLIDKQAAEWQQQAKDIQRGLSQVNQAISLTIQSYRIASRLLGNIIGPLENALIGIIQASMSTITSMVAAFAATGVGSVAAAIMASVSLSVSIAAFGDLTRSMGGIRGIVANIERRVTEVEARRGRTSHAFRTGGF